MMAQKPGMLSPGILHFAPAFELPAPQQVSPQGPQGPQGPLQDALGATLPAPWPGAEQFREQAWSPTWPGSFLLAEIATINIFVCQPLGMPQKMYQMR